MLDQNTDRMWYVIGAVIIGAAIILILNGTMPQLFASVAESFQWKVEETTTMTDGIGPKVRSDIVIAPTDLELYNVRKIDYVEETDTWTLEVPPAEDWRWWSSGFELKDMSTEIPYGSTFTLTYDVFIPEGVVGAYTEDDVNNFSADPEVESWNGNDNDMVGQRTFSLNGVVVPDHQKRRALEAGQWNTIKVIYNNTREDNVTESPIFDKTRFGVNNQTGEALQFQMRNIRWGLTE